MSLCNRVLTVLLLLLVQEAAENLYMWMCCSNSNHVRRIILSGCNGHVPATAVVARGGARGVALTKYRNARKTGISSDISARSAVAPYVTAVAAKGYPVHHVVQSSIQCEECGAHHRTVRSMRG